MQKRRRFVGRIELRLKRSLALLQCLPFGLQIWTSEAVFDGLDDLLDVALDAFQVAFGTAQAGALLHPEPVHLPGELAAELLEEILPHQLVLQRAEYPLLDLMPRYRQLVGAGPAIASAEASELLARIDDEAGAAFAALRETREQILWPPELVEALAIRTRLPFPLNARVSLLYCPPNFTVDDSQFGHVLRDPLSRRVCPGDTLASVRILQEPLTIPHQATDVQLVVENANASLRIPVN